MSAHIEIALNMVIYCLHIVKYFKCRSLLFLGSLIVSGIPIWYK